MSDEESSKLVRLIGKDGTQLGIVPFHQAVKLATGDHLIKLTDKISPPVYRIVDSSEYRKHRSN